MTRTTLRLEAGDLDWRDEGRVERRAFGDGADQCRDWISRYRRALANRQQGVLLGLGREMYAWLDGDGRWLERAIEDAEPPWLVEIAVPRRTLDESQKALIEAPGSFWRGRRAFSPLAAI